jgi:predicted nucleic acid-binding Zn ribbon protein
MTDSTDPQPALGSADNVGDDGDEAQAVYLRFRRIFGEPGARSNDARKRKTKKEGATVPFGTGRDPQGLHDVIDGLANRMGWASPLARSDLLSSWAEIAGAETAEHSTPLSIDDGVLTVQCDSTAWATQLRLMRTTITTHILTKYPDAGISSIRFDGPNAPSWKRGPRSIPGRGPRDTYG